jgi:hypothetical protein
MPLGKTKKLGGIGGIGGLGVTNKILRGINFEDPGSRPKISGSKY